MREPFKTLMQGDVTLETLTPVIRDFEREFKKVNADKLQHSNDESITHKHQAMSHDLSILRTLETTLKQSQKKSLPLGQLLLIITSDGFAAQDLGGALINCLMLMKEMFAELIAETLAQNNDPLSLLTLSDTLEIPQLIALIAALLDKGVGREKLLASGIFRDLLVVHCAQSAEDTQKAHKLINILTLDKHKEWLDSLDKISAEVYHLEYMTLTGNTHTDSQHITYHKPNVNLQLTQESWKILYPLLGYAALCIPKIFNLSNQLVLQEIINEMPNDTLLLLFLNTQMYYPESMADFTKTIWRMLTQDQQAVLQKQYSAPYFWHILFQLQDKELIDVLQKCDFDSLPVLNLDLPKILNLLACIYDKDLKRPIVLKFLNYMLTEIKASSIDYYEYRGSIIRLFQADPFVLETARKKIQELESMIKDLVKQEPFDWFNVCGTLQEYRHQANFLNFIVNKEDVSLLGKDAYAGRAFVVKALLQNWQVSTVEGFSDVIDAISENRDDEYKKLVAYSYLVYASNDELDRNLPIVAKYLKEKFNIENIEEIILNDPNFCGEHVRLLVYLLKDARPNKAKEVLAKNTINQTRFLDSLVDNQELLLKILELIPIKDRLEYLKGLKLYDESILHLVKPLKPVLELLPQEQRLAAILVSDSSGKNIVLDRIHDVEDLKEVMSVLPEDARTRLFSLAVSLNMFSSYDDFNMLRSESRIKTLKDIIKLLPEKDKLKALLADDSNGNRNILSFVIVNDKELFESIITSMPSKQILSFMQTKHTQHYILLNALKYNPQSLKVLLEHLSLEDKLQLIHMKYENKSFFIEELAEGPNKECLEILLQSLPKNDLLQFFSVYIGELPILIKSHFVETTLQLIPANERLQVLLEKQKDDNVLFYLISNCIKLKPILDLLPKEDLMKIFTINGSSYRSILALAALRGYTNDSLLTLLDILTEKTLLQEISKQDECGSTPLHIMAFHLGDLFPITTILARIPEKERLAVLQKKDNKGNSVLDILVKGNYFDSSLREIFDLLPPEDRLKVLQTKNKHGGSILHQSALRANNLRAILALYQEQDRVKVVLQPDKFGLTPLHIATNDPFSFDFLIHLFPQDKIMEILQLKDNSGKTVLNYAVDNLTIFELPLKEFRQALQIKDSSGNTVLHLAAAKPW